MRPDEIIVDNFACGGGASEGIEWALGWMIGNAVPPVMSEALVAANDNAPMYRRASA